MTTVLRRVLDPVRLLAVLPLRITRYAALRVARGSRTWEQLVDRALTEPVLLRGWDGGAPVPVVEPSSREGTGADGEPRPAAVPAAEGEPDPEVPVVLTGREVVDLTEDELADWAQMPYAAASARARELEPEGLRTLLEYERRHGHRPRFEQLLQHRLDVGPTRGTG